MSKKVDAIQVELAKAVLADAIQGFVEAKAARDNVGQTIAIRKVAKAEMELRFARRPLRYEFVKRKEREAFYS